MSISYRAFFDTIGNNAQAPVPTADLCLEKKVRHESRRGVNVDIRWQDRHKDGVHAAGVIGQLIGR